MIVLGIDPGPELIGWALYNARGRRVIGSGTSPLETVLALRQPPVGTVVLERVQSYGIAGSSLLRTAEVCGRLWQAFEAIGYPVHLLYRREVLKALDVTGKGNRDSLVRQRLIEMHGGTREAAVGRKASRGPLYGVSGDAWAALAVAVAYVETI